MYHQYCIVKKIINTNIIFYILLKMPDFASVYEHFYWTSILKNICDRVQCGL